MLLYNELPRGKPRGIYKESLLSYRSKLRGIEPHRFRYRHCAMFFICVICEICGLKSVQAELADSLNNGAFYEFYTT